MSMNDEFLNHKPDKFKEAIAQCDEINSNLCIGLAALRSESSFVKPENPRLVNGSVDLDNALRCIYPNDARWDFVIGYSGEAFFIEVHPADTANVDEMIKKVNWLKKWLATKARDLKDLHKCGVFHWIPSGRVKISKNSPQYRKIALNNLSIKSPLYLK